jgi:hypothetical protein
MGCYYNAMPLNPMSTFEPDLPCRVHDRVNDRTFEWKTGWADDYREYALAESDGVHFDGLILDGWGHGGARQGVREGGGAEHALPDDSPIHL